MCSQSYLLCLQGLANADFMARSASIPQHLSDFEAEHLDSFTLLFDFAALQKQLYQNATALGITNTNDACCTGDSSAAAMA